MENFIGWLFTSFFDVIDTLTQNTVIRISSIFDNWAEGQDNLVQMGFNLTLFSDIPIISTNVYDALLMFFSIFYIMIFIVISWKIIKKVVVKITRWNKW